MIHKALQCHSYRKVIPMYWMHSRCNYMPRNHFVALYIMSPLKITIIVLFQTDRLLEKLSGSVLWDMHLRFFLADHGYTVGSLAANRMTIKHILKLPAMGKIIIREWWFLAKDEFLSYYLCLLQICFKSISHKMTRKKNK